jgi:hypothetical protein
VCFRALFVLRAEVKKVDRDQEELVEWQETETRLKNLYVWTRSGGWTWQAVGVVTGFGGGMLVIAVGALLSAVAWMRGDATSGLSIHGLGSIFLLSTIPLLILGAHCLDLLDRRVERSREAASEGEGSTAVHGRHARSGVAAAVIVLMLLCGTGSKTRAQQTIFNVPSTDVLDRGKVYAELDASLKPDDSEAVPRFSSFVPRIVVGVGGRVEVGLNVTGNIQPGADSTTLVPTIKYKVYDGKDNGFAIAAGNHLFIPVRNRAYDVGNYVYLEFSKTFKKSGTRLTAGGYHFSDNVVATNAQRAGGQFGFEQPVSKTVTLAADYFTGKHAAGYFTPGVIFKVGKKTTGYAGYSIGNQNPQNGNHFFLLELGYNFN